MVLDCVRLLAAMLHLALSGRDKAAVLHPPRDLWVTANTRPEVLALYDGVLRSPHARRKSPAAAESSRRSRRRSGLFTARETFREGALLAANLGPRLGCGRRGLWPDRRRPPRRECDSGNLA